jgi:S-adenosylmethionine hydrolase
MEKPILVFQTDFTYKEGAICSMYGVVKSVDRSLEIFDGTHEIPHFDTWSASYRLYQYMRFWPKGTIFVSVVDPGVGTTRKACVAKTKDGYFVVTPDNGALTHIKAHSGIEEVREIDERVNRLKGTEGTSIFHGRDLFGYCAAKLASGIITYEEVGPVYSVDEIVVHEMIKPTYSAEKVVGILESCDPNFGNLWSNIAIQDFLNLGFHYGDLLNVMIHNKDNIIYQEKVVFAKSFGFVKKGEAVVYSNELLNLGIAINLGDFMEKHHVSIGPEWILEIGK